MQITEIHEVWKVDGYGRRVVARFIDAAEAAQASDALEGPGVTSFVSTEPVTTLDAFLATCMVRTGTVEKH